MLIKYIARKPENIIISFQVFVDAEFELAYLPITG